MPDKEPFVVSGDEVVRRALNRLTSREHARSGLGFAVTAHTLTLRLGKREWHYLYRCHHNVQSHYQGAAVCLRCDKSLPSEKGGLNA